MGKGLEGVFSESAVEGAALDGLEELGYSSFHGDKMAPSEPNAERATTLTGQLLRGGASRVGNEFALEVTRVMETRMLLGGDP